MIKKELTILGGYGAFNFGDDIMLYTLVRNLKRELPALKINIFCVSSNIELESFDKVDIFVFERKSKFKNTYSFLNVMLKTKLLIIAGGTVFTDEDSVGAFNHFLIAYLMGVKIAYIGVGVGNLKKISRIIKTKILFELSSVITFRDKFSFDFATKKNSSKNKFYLTEDIAYLYYEENIPIKHNTHNSRVLLINWRGLARYYDSNYLEKLENNFCDAIVRFIQNYSFEDIRILPLDSIVDEEISYRINKLLSNQLPNTNIKLIRETSFKKKLNEIAFSNFFISFRLHGLFFAKLFGIPSIGFNYSPKVSFFLNSIGSKDIIYSDKIDSELIYKYLQKSFSNYEDNRRFISEYKERFKKAKMNISILIKQLTSE